MHDRCCPCARCSRWCIAASSGAAWCTRATCLGACAWCIASRCDAAAHVTVHVVLSLTVRECTYVVDSVWRLYSSKMFVRATSIKDQSAPCSVSAPSRTDRERQHHLFKFQHDFSGDPSGSAQLHQRSNHLHVALACRHVQRRVFGLTLCLHTSAHRHRYQHLQCLQINDHNVVFRHI